MGSRRRRDLDDNRRPREGDDHCKDGRCSSVRTRHQTRHLGTSRKLPRETPSHFSFEPLHAKQREGVPSATGQAPVGQEDDQDGHFRSRRSDQLGRLAITRRTTRTSCLERGDKVLPQGRRDFLRDSSKRYIVPGERREEARSKASRTSSTRSSSSFGTV